MAAPAVTGAVALYKASRPRATPTEVRASLRYLGNFGWKTSTDPDSIHEPLLDVHRVAALGTFRVVAPTAAYAAPLTGGHDRGPRDRQPQLELLRTGSPQLQRRAGRLVRHAWRRQACSGGRPRAPPPRSTFRRRRRPARTRSRSSAPTGVGRAHRRSRSRSVRCRSPTSTTSMSQIEWLYQSRASPAAARRRCSARRARSPAPRWRCSWTARWTCPTATTDYFDDDDGKTGEGSINALAKARITGGCGPRRFCPTAYVTRAQMAMFLDRALALPNATTDYFDDDDGQDRRGQHQRARRVRASPAAAAPAATARPGRHARADGRLPVPRPPAGPPRLRARPAATHARAATVRLMPS